MRSVSQIYSEAVTTRNNYLQLTELNSGRSNSKLSIINLMTYVVAVCIHTYEAVLDLFQVRIAETLNGRINGTPDWYALTAKKFQYDAVTGMGDELVFNEDTMKVEYATVDASHRIVEKAAWQSGDDGNSIVLKVVKANTDSNELGNGIPYMPLSASELTAFKLFVKQIQFVGAEISCESSPGDIVTIVADKRNPIYYNDRYVTAEQAMAELQQAVIDFANNIDFNGYLYYQAVLDVIRKAEHISDVSAGIKVYLNSYSSESGAYGPQVELVNRARLKSGYVRFLDANSVMTVNSDNITLVAESQMDNYIASLNPQSND